MAQKLHMQFNFKLHATYVQQQNLCTFVHILNFRCMGAYYTRSGGRRGGFDEHNEYCVERRPRKKSATKFSVPPGNTRQTKLAQYVHVISCFFFIWTVSRLQHLIYCVTGYLSVRFFTHQVFLICI